jgi:hypothetical protein
MRKFETVECLYLKRAAHRYYGGEVFWLSGNELALQEFCGILKTFASEPRATLRFKLAREPLVPCAFDILIVKLQQEHAWHLSIDKAQNAVQLWMNNARLLDLCKTIPHAIADDSYCHDYSVTPDGTGFNPRKGCADLLDIRCLM